MTLNGNEYIVEKYYDYIGGQEAFIPAKYHGLPVTEIGKEAFKGTNITNVQFSNVKVIGQRAFSHCLNLHSFVVGEGVERINIAAFEFCQNLETITLPDSLTIMGDYVFENCIALTSLTVPKNVTYLGAGLLAGCYGITEIAVHEGNAKYYSQGNCIIDSNSNTLIAGCKTSVIPNGIEVVGMGAFQYNRGLTSIAIPDSVKVIGREAFSSCENLVNVSLGSLVERLEYGVFWGCESLESIILPSSLTYIGGDVFRETGLYEIIIPSGITTLEEHIFMDCRNLSSITIPVGVTDINDAAFEFCTSLKSIDLPSTLKTIGAYAFMGAGLSTITIPDGVSEIQAFTFMGCSNLKSIVIPESITSITGGRDQEYGTFGGCYRLLEVYNKSSLPIEAGSESFGYIAFRAKKVYNDINESNYVTIDDFLMYVDGDNRILVDYIGDDEHVVLPTNLTEIAGGALNRRNSIKQLVVPEGITSMNTWSFAEMRELNSITIPHSVKCIKYYAMYYCDKLEDIYYDGTIAEWNSIQKDAENNAWDGATGDYIIHCTDGDIAKS